MLDSPSMDAAARRLTAALDLLEATLERRLTQEEVRAGFEDQVQALGVDRARLAAELDQIKHFAEGLEAANQDVSRRISHAVESIRFVLEEAER